jgi:hypothetical protein
VTRTACILLLLLAACADDARKLPPSTQAAPAASSGVTHPDIHAPGLDLTGDPRGWKNGAGRHLRHVRHRLEIIDGAHTPAWLASDHHGGYDLLLVDRAQLHISGPASGTLVVLDAQGLALLRITRDAKAGKATAADGMRRPLGSAQAAAGKVLLFAADGSPAGEVTGIMDPGLGLAVGLSVLPEDARALLAASSAQAP